MDYAGLNDTIQKKVMAALAIINNPEVAPDVRQLNQEILFREFFFAGIFPANFSSTIFCDIGFYLKSWVHIPLFTLVATPAPI